ncbi:acyl-CoA dehydratase activase-related protein [Tepidibacter thalassicus]|uniref:Predicted nucleotide-binding protein, sugar kinase/HSP70/actin superfamily n=1 Tax=Tepidibacter thalassicus DSM 15285 TaxID=1123350 RepID=A0A1M5SNS9_9FIRM|nr:acyl-CoA dehydratase activase-related protein [Tepidibacter thalassicus]SHH40181.1 Predicted nucleotide-binding protein, sugar kinase/HSP70/actin superfamily [Tepidibacter thalassicus DSM 15285]
MKIGIPRALLFHEYAPLWTTFFEELGAQVIISENTNKKILNEGVQNTVDDACLPVKLFHGHVLNLKDKVDYIFIPRIMSLFKGEHICPKFCGLPEMIKNSIKDLPEIINTEINFIKSKDNLNETIYEIGKYFSTDFNTISRAYDIAYLKFEEYKKNMLNNIPNKNNKKIMLMGHTYNLYDTYVNMNTINKINLNEIDVLTPQMIDDIYINEYAKKYKGKIFWTFARKLIGTTLYLIENKIVNGIIYVSSFGCGIDSVVADTIERYIKRESDIPFMLLTLDEHTGEGGLNTRIEAFIDMIKWRDKNESNVPTHG